MKFGRGDGGVRILVGDGQSLAAGSGAAVEDARSLGERLAEQGSYQLRGFVLNDDRAGAKGAGFRDVSGVDGASGGKERSAGQSDLFGLERGFGFRLAQADAGCGDRLIVPADGFGDGEPIVAGPAFD